MTVHDLRHWLRQVESMGQVRPVNGANAEAEIGAIVDLATERPGRPALLFDEIPGYMPGRRVLANVLTSQERVAITSGLPHNASRWDLIAHWRSLFRTPPLVPHRSVADGPILTNRAVGDAIDLTRFPAPHWHEQDGGPYIGTGCLVVMKDPDTGWVNTGAYRVQRHGPRELGVMITSGRHGDHIMRKYWARNQPCPVAISLGHHPLMLMLAGVPVPEGICEYDLAGGILGEAVPTVAAPHTGLPIPSHAELVAEGEIWPGELHPEGPFGEWTGYYAAPLKDEPLLRVQSVSWRDDPINLGIVPGMPPSDNTYFFTYLVAAQVWSQLEGAGIPGVRGVWVHEAAGSRMFQVVSLQQQYPGHAKQAAVAAAACKAGGYVNRFTVAVDDDIDASDLERVLWAMCTRMDPREDLEVLRHCQASPLDPMAYPEGLMCYNARVVIDACRPWDRLKQFPPVAKASPALRAATVEHWGHLFGSESLS